MITPPKDPPILSPDVGRAVGKLSTGYRIAKSKMPLWPKLLLIAALIYGVLPVDFLPDVIPVIGWIDDILIGFTLITTALAGILSHLKGRAKAKDSPGTSRALSSRS